ncbi:uncharacterized protein VTP21DRAFT_72 [Calcarisporiella thermophila]|uniref:uncharacterized protein n=1 Tax=Calcarisporiella thermophila TaxID=911321 RepID=UPI003743EFBA
MSRTISFVVLLCLFSLLSPVMAANYAFTEPVASTVWVAGRAVTLKWKIDQAITGPFILPARVDIQLLENGQLVQNALTGVAGATGNALWTIPATLAPSTQYQLRIGTSDQDYSYSSRFTINGANGQIASRPISSSVQYTTLSQALTSNPFFTPRVAPTGLSSASGSSAPVPSLSAASSAVSRIQTNASSAITASASRAVSSVTLPSGSAQPSASSPAKSAAVRAYASFSALGGLLALCAVLVV